MDCGGRNVSAAAILREAMASFPAFMVGNGGGSPDLALSPQAAGHFSQQILPSQRLPKSSTLAGVGSGSPVLVAHRDNRGDNAFI